MKRKTAIIVLLGLVCVCVYAQTTKKAASEKKDVASYYADRFHGRKMANGEKYHRDSFTCAHLRFALGTMLRVRNPKNSKECIVEVTDRGPYSRRFTIDLSRAAARHLGIIGSGFAVVEVTPFHGGKVPYRLGPIDYPEVTELEIDYEPAASYPYPVWQDSADESKEPVIRLPLSK